MTRIQSFSHKCRLQCLTCTLLSRQKNLNLRSFHAESPPVPRTVARETDGDVLLLIQMSGPAFTQPVSTDVISSIVRLLA
jgi:hypothetical protein